MLRITLIILFVITLFRGTGFAQDTLPNILVKNISGKIIISWKNNYGAKISTLNVQRSGDSLKNFTTFASVLNPMNKQNGIVDTKAPNTNMFYRVFVAFEGGSYFFSKSVRPVVNIDTVATKVSDENNEMPPPSVAADSSEKTKTYTLKPLRIDSFTTKAKMKVRVISPQPATIELGRFIFTGKDNNIIIRLADADKRKYSILFFDDKGNKILELKKITEPYLILDKVNFRHIGTFGYELYDNGDLLEKYRVIIQKDSKN
ncbi:hypothetical protein [Ferruginibacter albus]|uniref:hypothetical protein n=1 Tax=Ferruginibacter albus TaxID=2875540 RepID=UPI001CC6D162|nr:hypothetical protein [Ferruginibacter albus]UAY53554.1 hypothetical protein K9M53_07775 [Ferruginibacter albus]